MKTKEAKRILSQNGKMVKTSKELGVRIFNFGITAYKSIETGKVICPFAGSCKKFCYAQKGSYSWSNVALAFERRYKQTKEDSFVSMMDEAIKILKVDYLRVHDSGDFYSPTYVNKWFDIARLNPDTKFYSYTKSLDFFRINNRYDYGVNFIDERPNNFDIIFSFGGKLDHTIDIDNERHARIFNSKEELVEAGYTDTSKYDLYATKWFNESNKVGLILH